MIVPSEPPYDKELLKRLSVPKKRPPDSETEQLREDLEKIKKHSQPQS